MVKIKICGNTRLNDIQCLVDMGVDHAGFIFYPRSPRYISPERLQNILSHLEGNISKVGVFVDEDIDSVRDIYYRCELDIIQLHGKEIPEYCDDLGLPYWKVFRITDDFDMEDIHRYGTDTFLLDAYHKHLYGGTGEQIPMKLLDRWLEATSKLDKQVIVAGGVGLDNIEDIISLKPYGVDINSSVEISPGVKDRDMMVSIVERINDRR